MAFYRNVAGQKVAVYAWDTANDVPKTGDAANITAQITKDWGTPAATDDTNPTELDATDHPGIYVFTLTQAESNADAILVSAVSSTADIVLEPVLIVTTDRHDFGIIAAGIAQAADGTSLTMAAAESFGNDTLIGATLHARGSDQGYWQTRVILDSAADVLTVSTWTVTPTGTIEYVIFGSAPGEGVAQSGDAYADTQTLLTRLGTPSDLGGGATVAANLVVIEGQTDDIGAAGAGLTTLATAAELAKVPKSDGTATWNATALASIQSEANDALVAYDPPTKAELDAAAANVSVDEIQATALADLFNTDSGTTYASAVAGSVVKEVADNAGGSSLTVGDIADAVWEEAIADHSGTAGSTAEQLAAAGSAGDPWATALPGAYTSGQAGKILGDNLDASVSTRATPAQVNSEVVDALTIDVIADSIPVDGARPTIAQACYIVTQFLLERSVSGTIMTIKKPDGSTALLTLSLNDASTPTSVTRAS